MNEIWKPIPGEPLYEASSLGRIRSIPRVVRRRAPDGQMRDFQYIGTILRPRTRKAKPGCLPYLDVNLSSGAPKPHSETVHKLVALAFHGPKPSKHHEVAHADDNPANNRPDNLAWSAPTANRMPLEQYRKRAREMARARDPGSGRFRAATPPA